nr:Trk system potassium transporter TrkA [Paracoccus sp. (in: a-proteobacteria)]
MRIIICGAGQVGWQIARLLAGEHNDIVLIDRDEALIRQANDALDVQGIVGHASHPEVLDRAGAADCDLVIAATASDEVNIVACEIAHAMFGVPRRIARLRAGAYLDPRYADLYRSDHLPIDVVINPEQEIALAAVGRVDAPTTFDTESFMDGRVRMLGLALTDSCPILHTPLRQLDETFYGLGAVVVGIRRGTRLFAPEPNNRLMPGDLAYVVTPVTDVARTLDIFGRPAQPVRRVVVVGGGRVGLSVAQMLESRTGLQVKLIERERVRADAAAD